MKVKLTLGSGNYAQPAAAAAPATPQPNSGSSPPSATTMDLPTQLNHIMRTLRDARDRDTGRVFSTNYLTPPSREEHPDYYQLITNVIALDTIQSRIDTNSYRSFEDFRKDFNALIANAQQYNKTKSAPWRDAVALKEVFDATIQEMGLSTQPTLDTAQVSKLMSLEDMRSILKRITTHTDEEGRVLSEMFEELPDRKTYADYYQEIKNPICLDIIREKLEGGEYDTPAKFEADMKLMFNNAQTYNQEGSEIYEDAVELQKLFEKLSGKEGAALSVLVIAPEGDSLDEIVYKGESWRVGDWCHIRNPLDPSRPTIGQIWEIIKNADVIYIKAMWYLRPEQTVQPQGAKFYENEVFKTNTTMYYNIEEVENKCYVLWWRQYHKGRPRGFSKHLTVYACESRYSEQGKKTEKIKNWQQCLPGKGKIEIENFLEPKSQRKYLAEFSREDAHTQTPPISRKRMLTPEPAEATDNAACRRSKSPDRDGLPRRPMMPNQQATKPASRERKPPPPPQGPILPLHLVANANVHLPTQLKRHAYPIPSLLPCSAVVDMNDHVPPKTASYFDTHNDGRIKWYAAPPLDIVQDEPTLHSLEYLVYKRRLQEDVINVDDATQPKRPRTMDLEQNTRYSTEELIDPITRVLQALTSVYERESYFIAEKYMY
ncbi:hypothetical protein SeLEV6574_g05290 [Synchytrium endobioticum]|nr:hypothetical protein SeLEV6574_g05290 [Synchytrium endobioticum]